MKVWLIKGGDANLITFSYVVVALIIVFTGHGYEVVKTLNNELGVHISGFAWFYIIFTIMLLFECLQDIISKLHKLEKKIKEMI